MMEAPYLLGIVDMNINTMDLKILWQLHKLENPNLDGGKGVSQVAASKKVQIYEVIIG